MSNYPPTIEDVKSAVMTIDAIIDSGMFDDFSTTVNKLYAAKATLKGIKDAFAVGYKHLEEET